MDNHQIIIDRYNEDLTKMRSEIVQAKKLSLYFSIARLIFFIVFISLFVFCVSENLHFGWIVGITGVLLFLYIVKHHQLIEQKLENIKSKKLVIENEISAINNFVNKNYDGSVFINEQHDYTWDLDIFGPFSLFALINRARSYEGLKTLANNLSSTTSIEDIYSRREAIQELENENNWRVEYMASLIDIEEGYKLDVAKIVSNTLTVDLSFASSLWLKIYRQCLPFIWMLTISLYYFTPNGSFILGLIICIINFRITTGYSRQVAEIQNRLSAVSFHLSKFRKALGLILSRSWSSKILNKTALRDENGMDKNPHIDAITQLKHLSDLLDYRLNMIMSFILNIGFLWDSRIISRLQKWRNDYQFIFNHIFSLIGDFESFVSLATWSYNHPDYSYPEIDTKYFHLESENMGHPLLKKTVCVANDFIIEKGEYVNIITGSNMSGKSTFLRTVGLNIILGNSGTKACATRMAYGLVTLITYMRVRDDLEENVSTFKAELIKVERILELLKFDKRVFILADEMLRGTNSKDKLKGSEAIINKILNTEAYALVATHDLGLTQITANGVKNYYFDIDFVEGDLNFDYEIKKGICNNFNASFLLKQLGLEISDK